jgi:hypothetical protein
LSWKFAKTKKAPYRGPGFVVFVEPVGVEPTTSFPKKFRDMQAL